MSHTYVIRYTVEAVSRLDAIAKATRMLRENVALNAVLDTTETRSGWWDVRMHVAEDDAAVDHPANARWNQA